MVSAVEDEIVGGDDGLGIFRSEMFPVGDVCREGVESVYMVSI